MSFLSVYFFFSVLYEKDMPGSAPIAMASNIIFKPKVGGYLENAITGVLSISMIREMIFAT